MKASNYIISSLVALCFLITSCSSNKFSKQITQIDSLNVVLDSSFSKLNSLDTSVVQSYYLKYSDNIKLIRNNFKEKEKEDEEIWSIITRYGMIKKPLRDFKKNFVKYSKEISISHKQLNDLKSDIKNNILTKDQIIQYIKEESEFVKYINVSVSGLMENTKIYFNQYLELNPKVEKYFQNAKSNNVIDNAIENDNDDD